MLWCGQTYGMLIFILILYLIKSNCQKGIPAFVQSVEFFQGMVKYVVMVDGAIINL